MDVIAATREEGGRSEFKGEGWMRARTSAGCAATGDLLLCDSRGCPGVPPRVRRARVRPAGDSGSAPPALPTGTPGRAPGAPAGRRGACWGTPEGPRATAADSGISGVGAGKRPRIRPRRTRGRGAWGGEQAGGCGGGAVPPAAQGDGKRLGGLRHLPLRVRTAQYSTVLYSIIQHR